MDFVIEIIFSLINGFVSFLWVVIKLLPLIIFHRVVFPSLLAYSQAHSFRVLFYTHKVASILFSFIVNTGAFIYKITPGAAVISGKLVAFYTSMTSVPFFAASFFFSAAFLGLIGRGCIGFYSYYSLNYVSYRIQMPELI